MIPPLPAGSTDARKYWESRHGQLHFENVYSVTADPELRGKIIGRLIEALDPLTPCRILVPGCGTRALLERDIVTSVPAWSVLATDYPAVARAAAERLQHPRVAHSGKDTRALELPAEYDAAVVINAVLSDSDVDNRAMLHSVYEALRPGGLFIGLFPTIFAAADVGLCEERERWRLELVDLLHSRYCFDEHVGATHILYTPLRLRAILREAEFTALQMEVFFCESPCLREEAARVYGLEGPDVVLYELLVTSRKGTSALGPGDSSRRRIGRDDRQASRISTSRRPPASPDYRRS
jgi:SAM-dependent methyltransferase